MEESCGSAFNVHGVSSRATIVIITGFSCTGKTTLAKRLALTYSLPIFYKDRFKEMMFDTFDAEVIEQIGAYRFSQQLGRVCVECLKIVMDEAARANQSAIYESNFDRALFSPYLQDLQTRHPNMNIVQVLLYADAAARADRFIEREKSDRHPGHRGMERLALVQQGLANQNDSRALEMLPGGTLLEFDTTDFDSVDWSPLYAALDSIN